MRTYETWKKQVDRLISNVCGLTSDDLPDYNYRECFGRGESPSKVARKAISAARRF